MCTPIAAMASTQYEVPVELRQAVDIQKVSMANDALKHTADVIVDGNHGKYRVYLRPISLMGMNGKVTNFFKYNDAQKLEIKAQPTTGEYATSYTFDEENGKVNDIKIAVWVDVMDQLAGGGAGSGEQDAYLHFDWAKAKEIGHTNVSKPQGNEAIQVYVENQKIQFDSQPVIQGGRTLVPLRAIFEALGADVKWDGTTRSVIAQKNGTTIKLVIDQRQASVNQKNISLDTAPSIIQGRTMVPLRFIGEAFGNKVDFHHEGNIAIVDIH